jgi:serine/threonine protein kinase
VALTSLRSGDPPHCGPYRLQGRLGAGGMGVVYLAFGPDNAPVAIKVLLPMLAQDDQYRARFVREVEAARLVNSRYVARVVAAQTDSDLLWMATEYVEGPTLAQAVESNGPVPADRLRGLATDLASAVSALHSAGLVHRDLKPANVVLAWSGPKLIDFGIAKQEGSTDLTQTGVTVGSLVWMSPEVLNGGPASRASDIFAWGLCVAFAGTGRAPFGDGNPSVIAYRIAQAEPDLHGLPPELADLVRAALAKDQTGRPSDASLCSALGGRGAPATAVALPRPQGGWTGPNPAAPAQSTQPPVQLPSLPGPPQPPARTSRRSLGIPLAAASALLAAAAAAAAIAIVVTTHRGPSHPVAQNSPLPTASTSVPSTPPSTPPSTSVPGTSAPTSAPARSTPAEAAAALDQLLSTSSRSRADVVAAVAAAQSCEDPAGAASTLALAADERTAELQQLGTTDLTAVDSTGQLARTLTDALTSSRAADLSFAAWAASVSGCSAAAPLDADYASAGTSSTAATAAKQEFVNLWNPVASKYGLTLRSMSGI